MADRTINQLPERTVTDDTDAIPVWASNGTFRISYATLKAGAAPTFTIGTVTTLEEGEAAYATITGTSGYPVLNLGLPKGPKGNPPNLTIGTVTTLPAGEDAEASITGTAANPVLNLSIPQGDSGYELTRQDKEEITQMVLDSLPSLVGVSF